MEDSDEGLRARKTTSEQPGFPRIYDYLYSVQHGPQRCPSPRQSNNTLRLCLAHSRRVGRIHGSENLLARAHDEPRTGLAQPDISGDGGLYVFFKTQVLSLGAAGGIYSSRADITATTCPERCQSHCSDWRSCRFSHNYHPCHSSPHILQQSDHLR